MHPTLATIAPFWAWASPVGGFWGVKWEKGRFWGAYSALILALGLGALDWLYVFLFFVFLPFPLFSPSPPPFFSLFSFSSSPHFFLSFFFFFLFLPFLKKKKACLQKRKKERSKRRQKAPFWPFLSPIGAKPSCLVLIWPRKGQIWHKMSKFDKCQTRHR